MMKQAFRATMPPANRHINERICRQPSCVDPALGNPGLAIRLVIFTICGGVRPAGTAGGASALLWST